MPTKVTTRDVKVEGDKLVVRGEAAKTLVTGLVQKHTETMAEIAGALGFVHPKDITIEADGSVHIANAPAAQKVNAIAMASSGSDANLWDTNCGCK